MSYWLATAYDGINQVLYLLMIALPDQVAGPKSVRI
jgi:hypothetical protein